MGEAATSKYKASEANKYPLSSFSPMSYGDASWSDEYRSAVDRYNQEGKTKQIDITSQFLTILALFLQCLKVHFHFRIHQSQPVLDFPLAQ